MGNFFLTIMRDEGDREGITCSEHMGIHEHDESGGSEFLTDSIRMTEQPLQEYDD